MVNKKNALMEYCDSKFKRKYHGEKKVLDDATVGNVEEVEIPYPKDSFDIIIILI